MQTQGRGVGEEQLGNICIEMIPSAVGKNNVIEREGIHRKKDGAQHGPLRDATGKWMGI